ncbi:MAG: DUF2155 domain-containing protein [Desulfuromonadaceae bacterium]|nr:DUF2155 domain-containing protein [Desulfuromonadaceae bacterium]
MSVLYAAQEGTDSPITLRPAKSHSRVKEKLIIVPPEVSQQWKAVRLSIVDKVRGMESTYTLPIGSTTFIHASELSIAVDAFLPAFTMEGTTITSSSNELINPSAWVRIYEHGSPVFQGWLFSKFPNRLAATHRKYGFGLVGAVPVVR